MKRLINIHTVLVIILLSGMCVNIRAQESNYIFVKNVNLNGENVIKVKWFTKEIYTLNEVNVYRKEKNDSSWTLLNDKSLKFGDYNIPEEQFRSDSALQMLVDMVKSTPRDQIQGITAFIVMVGAVQKNAFARYLGVIYEDNTIEANKLYSYKITEIANGLEKVIAISPEISSDIETTVEGPKQIEIIPDNKAVYLKWLPETERYYAVNIYRKDSANTGYELLNSQPIMISEIKDENGEMKFPEVFYSDKDLQNEKQYYYQLKAVDFFGEESSPSEEIKTIPTNRKAPPPPDNFVAIPSDYAASLAWEYKKENKIIGYNIYRSRRIEGKYTLLNKEPLPPSSRSYLDKNLEPRGYYYYIASIDDHGLEGISPKEFVKVQDTVPPQQPQNVTMKADTGMFVIEWTANTDPDLLGYNIYRRVKNAKFDSPFLINRRPVLETKYVDPQPKNVKNTFIYQIAAVDSSRNKSILSEPSTARMPDVTAPDKPYIKTAGIDGDNVNIIWKANLEEDLAGYYVFRSGYEGEASRQLNELPVPANQTKYIDNSTVPGKDYRYSLVAVDNSGNRSLISDEYPVAREKKTLAPVALDDFRGKFQKRSKKVVLSWDVPEAKEGYLGVIVYRKINDGNWKTLSGLIKDGKFEDKNIEPSKGYSYELRTFNETGEQWKSKQIKITISEF